MHNTQTAVGIRPPWWPAGGRPPTSLFAYLRDAALALPLYPLSGSGHFAPGGISPPYLHGVGRSPFHDHHQRRSTM